MNNPFETEEITHRFIVGIDLGTTNSALAYVDLAQKAKTRREIQFLEFPQLTGPGEVSRRSVLPSFLYLPGSYELPAGSTALPWDPHRDYAVGEFAREQGALVPGRMVSSAKSWLCHGGVDRTAAILPWGAASDVPKVSPVEASARYLQHMRESWNAVIAKGREGYRLEEQVVILTVPASFDEVARELTVAAAQRAGLPRVILLEEPLASFYSWLSLHEHDWQSLMQAGQLILVCDVGGGTTDFTLIAIRQGEKDLCFDRLAVGDHLMLGGDNMDLSLARHLEMQLRGQHGQLDSKRWHQLWHQCRRAKETLLGSATPASESPTLESEERQPSPTFVISIMGAGRKLIADTLKGSLSQAQVKELILEGFFPYVSLDEAPQGSRRSGLTEWGLPFVQDPAVTRHLAAFWQRHLNLMRQETGRTQLYPDFLLFNGGALTPASIRERIRSVVQRWFQAEAAPGWSPIELENSRPELAVALGAAYYGLVRQGEGVRVGAGSPRSYYVQVGAGSPDGEASEGKQTAVCLIPRGTEEGFETQLSRPAFEVLANQPVAFQLYSSSTRLGDRPGEIVQLPPEEITILPPIRTVLRYGKKSGAQSLPVLLAVRLTEVGTLELWCRSQKSPHQWQLQFDVRQAGGLEPQTASQGETLDMESIEQAQEAILAVFQKSRAAAAAPPEKLTRNLVSILELGKEKWPTPLIRKLSDTLLETRKDTFLTPQHEARWFNLLGYCMRPGFGDPLDEWRMKEIWKIYPQGLQFPRQAQNRTEWWIFWRRVAGGLTAGHQWYIFQQVWPTLQTGDRKKKKTGKKALKSLSPQEEMEIWMALANFERLPAGSKADLGQLVLDQIHKGKPKSQELWALGRFGARIPFYGPLDTVIPGGIASDWLNRLLDLNMDPTEATAHALVQLARLTGDRERDLPAKDLDRLAQWLNQLPEGARYQEVLSHPDTSLLAREHDWIFGEALPAGLVLSATAP